MSKEQNSKKQILKSSSIIGGASILNIAVNLLKIKAAAVWLGPSGVGIIGLLQSLIQTASLIASVGIGTSGARQVASAVAEGNETAIVSTRKALFLAAPLLAILGAAGFAVLAGLTGSSFLPPETTGWEVAWLALGVGLSTAAFPQTAYLNGHRKILDLALITVGTAMCSTVAGILSIFFLREQGIVLFVLASPAAALCLGYVFVHRSNTGSDLRLPASLLLAQWQQMGRLGIAVMVSSALTPLALILVRLVIQNLEGSDALGQFQASWNISITYIGFVLAAMGTDYFPRLSAVISDKPSAVRLVNEQSEVALLLAGPVLIAMIGLSPLVISLLYSHEFDLAAELFRWQIVGDVLKIASWPLGFVLLASGAGSLFVATELIGALVFVCASWIGIPFFGLKATGIAFVLMYSTYLPLVYIIARSKLGFRWTVQVARQIQLLAVLSVVLLALCIFNSYIGATAAVLVSLLLAAQTIVRFASMLQPTGPLAKIAAISSLISKKFKL